MKLLDNFYTINNKIHDGNFFVYMLSFNKDHEIYKAHFPENPITPGVCIIHICKELMELETEKKLSLKKVQNIKFLSIIDPTVVDTIQFSFSKVIEENGSYQFSVLVHDETTQFAKLTLRCMMRNMKYETMEDLAESRITPNNLTSHICIIIPTYNNQQFLTQVLDAVLLYKCAVIVVNDGSTDATFEILETYHKQIHIVSYSPNRGKGHALNLGFDKAELLGFNYAITMDSDGQHKAEDLPLFFEAIEKNPNSMILGSRVLKQQNMPGKNTFANKFSNFWFAVQTGRKLPDTQTGFRLYPLSKMRGMRSLTPRYEAELELLVRLAWKNIPLTAIPIHVYYPEESERVSHFRPGPDFARISLMNTIFCFVAIFYGYPSIFFRKLTASIISRLD